MSDFLKDADFDRFKTLIYDESGIHFSDANRTILEGRIRDALRNHGVATLDEFYSLLKKDGEALKGFLDAVTTNLTRFFRNQGHYDTFIKYVIPELVAYKTKKGDRTFSIWSAGCSTGEEPYTNAMVLKEHLPKNFNIQVTASDLSLKSLMTAKAGLYSKPKVAGVPQEYLQKYFTEEEGGYRVNDEIRKLIRFDYHNMKFPTELVNLDVVFCRNVLIYFDVAAQKNVVETFWKAMTPHSYLFIGHSESLFGMKTGFKFIRTDWACIYGKIEG